MALINMLLLNLIYSFTITIRFKFKQEESMVLALFVVFLVPYICGIFNILIVEKYLLYILAIISIIYLIKRRKEINIKKLFTIPTIIYIFVMIGMYVLTYDLSFSQYDEFMFWGINVKTMLSEGILWASESFDGVHLVYPMYTGLIQYISCVFNGEFRDGICYFAMITTMLMPTILLFRNEKQNIKSLLKTILFLVFTYVTIVFFQFDIANLSVDCILGIIFAISMYYAFFCKTTKEYFVLTILLIELTLIKTNGILFAGIVLLEILLKRICRIIKIKKKSKKKIKFKKFWKTFIVMVIMVMSTFLTWKIYYTLNGKQIDDRHDKNYVENINIEEFINTFIARDKISNKTNRISNSFFEDIITLDISNNSYINTTAKVFVLINVVSIATIIFSKKKTDKIIYLIVYNLGIFVYAILMLIVFLYVFVDHQGYTMMGFERYASCIMISFLLGMVYVFLNKTSTKNLIVMLILTILMMSTISFEKYNPYETRAQM